MPGKFITFEGGEGVGKSTQAKLLAERLSTSSVKTYLTREPGGDVIGEEIRNLLKKSEEIDPVCEVMMIFAARRDHFVKIISPKLEQNYFVICDRFYDSSLIYQGLLKRVSIEDIMRLKQMAIGTFEPDFTIILDASFDTSHRRITERNLIPDEYDLMNRKKYDLIRSGFQKMAEIFSFRSVLINTEKSENIVSEKIWKTFQNL
ncbi:MAG: dTMP kinase [Holosporaceae bacterium]|jgi:dTMP kinase|nr:dTMP kinase [Holosporaceae bacterium]